MVDETPVRCWWSDLPCYSCAHCNGIPLLGFWEKDVDRDSFVFGDE